MDLSKEVTKRKIHLNERVKLNVGGHFFETTLATLVSHDGMLKTMFESNLAIKKDPDGSVFIDRDGQYFSEILNFLRRDFISLSRPKKELEDILAEAEFFRIESLICMLKKKTSTGKGGEKKPYDYQNVKIIRYTQNSREYLEPRKILVEESNQNSKPVVCLGINLDYHDTRAVALKRFLDISKIYSDVYQFILYLHTILPHQSPFSDRKISIPNWYLYRKGKFLEITEAMISSPRNVLLEFFARSVRHCEPNVIILVDNKSRVEEIIARSSKKVVYLEVGLSSDTVGAALELLLDVSEKFSDAYQFIVHLVASERPTSSAKWTIYQNKEPLRITRTMNPSLCDALFEILATKMWTKWAPPNRANNSWRETNLFDGYD